MSLSYDIIVPTLGKSHSLSAVLTSLMKTVRGKATIFVVQNGSISDTAANIVESLRRYSRTEMHYLHEPIEGLLAARHKGFAAGAGDIICFVDDDVIVSDHWFDAVSAAFADSSIAMVGGPSLAKYECAPPDWLRSFFSEVEYGGRACSRLSLLNLGQRNLDVRPDWIWGLNYSIRRSVLEAVGGFHPDGVPWELRRFRGDGESGASWKVYCAGFRAVYRYSASVEHVIPSSRLTLEYFERRFFLEGISRSFSHLRSVHGLTPSAPCHNRSLVDRIRQRLWRTLRRKPVVSTASNILTRMESFMHCGYEYHQHAFSKDKAVRDWVLQKTYWNYAYPICRDGA